MKWNAIMTSGRVKKGKGGREGQRRQGGTGKAERGENENNATVLVNRIIIEKKIQSYHG